MAFTAVHLRLLVAVVLGVLTAGTALPQDAPSSATTLYVAPDGADDNSGTFVSPFRSLEKALALAQPGDTIYLRGGFYPIVQSIKVTVSGLPGYYIHILAYPGEHPTFDASGMTETGYWDGWLLDLSDVSWLHIAGLEIRNATEGGIVLRGTSAFNIIENLDVHHNGRLSRFEGKGISVYGEASNNLILKNDSHHNYDMTGANADGFQVAVTGLGNILRGNRAWRNSDDGFDFFNVDDSPDNAPVLIEYNYAWENGFDDNLNPIGNGVGFKLGGQRPGIGATSGGHIVRFNLAWRNSSGGFDANDSTRPSILTDNRLQPTEAELDARFGPPPAW